MSDQPNPTHAPESEPVEPRSEDLPPQDRDAEADSVKGGALLAARAVRRAQPLSPPL